MTFAEWLSDTAGRVRDDGVAGLRESAFEFYVGAWRRAGMLYNYGTPVYDEDWDVLVVLDACRADLMAEVQADYDYLDGETTYSVGSTSPEWMAKNFTDEAYRDEVARTAYVTGNPFTGEVFFEHRCGECGADRDRVEADPTCPSCGATGRPERVPTHRFDYLDEAWQYGWDGDLGTMPPDVITDRGIQVARERDPDRLVLHYMQPHHPFVNNPFDEGLDPDTFGYMSWKTVWDKVQAGAVSKADAWEGYRDNLHYVLESVETLLANVDGTVAITADHGNAIGDFGLYGHYKYIPLRVLKQVPWCVTEATDSGEYEPDLEPPGRSDDEEVADRLRDLGYIE